MSKHPVNSTAKVYYDTEGNEVTLRQLIKLEPEWAHSRIKAGEEALERNKVLTEALEEARIALNFMGVSTKKADKALDNGGEQIDPYLQTR